MVKSFAANYVFGPLKILQYILKESVCHSAIATRIIPDVGFITL